MKQLLLLSACIVGAGLAACSSAPTGPAPVLERSVSSRSTAPVAARNPTPSGGALVASNTVSAGTNSTSSANSTNNNSNNSSNNSGTTVAPMPKPAAALPPAAIGNASSSPVVPVPAAAMPGASNADGKVHVVKKGDTLYSIALDHGVAYRDLAAWNGVANPAQIKVDQVLRLSPATGNINATNTAPIAPASIAQPLPTAPNPVSVQSVQGPQTTTTVSTAAAPVPAPIAAPQANTATTTPNAATDIVWQWPSKGKLSVSFAEGKSKGVDLVGKMGDPIVAAADGKVVYSGNALKGYGQMLVIKHSEVYLTAYAHNSLLLVKDDETVKRGQKIALMGNTESDKGQVKLHFELRRSGKPVDPIKLLPPMALPQ